ncbi:hypothetical protein ACTACD_11650 [Pseudomonas syringae]|uniref:hypothetical protein n=1 Tax=Pseudomonas syringae TaxID=317 RepID=UPI003F761603
MMTATHVEGVRVFKTIMVLIAMSLSSVTAVSVGMAMFAMIDNLFMASVFAAAAVVLDLYKYLAWPLAIAAWFHGKKICAVLMVISAITLGAVSAWATYDRLHNSISASHTRFESSQQKVSELTALRSLQLDRLAVIDAEARSMREQAKQLRDRGIVTKAQDLDALAMSSAASQRQQVFTRVENLESEITALQTIPAPSAVLPSLILIFICAGFALALEVVPALLGVAIRAGENDVRSTAPLPGHAESTAPATEPATAGALSVVDPAPATTTPETPATSSVTTTTDRQQDLFGCDDSRLMQTLISMTESTSPGTPIKVRDFTAVAKVGNRRTIKLFHTAMEVGLLKRTSAGYVAA